MYKAKVAGWVAPPGSWVAGWLASQPPPPPRWLAQLNEWAHGASLQGGTKPSQ